MDKIERMLYVRDIVDRYKRINVSKALERFCVITGLEANPNLRKNIGNDLDSLTEIGYVYKEYFYLDGAPMDYETAQTISTKDLHYVLTTEGENIFGIGLLNHCESMLISAPNKVRDWSIIELSGSLKDNDISFAMKMDKNGILGINISALEIPLTLLIAE